MKNKKSGKLTLIAVSIIALIALTAVFTVSCNTATQEAAETTAAQETVEETMAAETTATETTVAETTAAEVPFEGQSLIISGSTTLLEVSNSWAEAFMAKLGGEVTVNGGGSGVGIADLINGANDLGNSSRKIKDEELETAKSAGVEVKEYVVLYDGIAVIVSKNIEVSELSIQQLSDIYTGKITNWSDVGGPDTEIVAVARDSASGTGEYFLERVVMLKKTVEDNDYSELCLRLQSNADIVNQVSGNENCIGYIGLGYLESAASGSNTVAVVAEDADSGIVASVDSVKDGSYPISRELYVYANSNKMSEIATAFVDFMLSDEGQIIGEDSGFVSIK